jgi:hypothetical protein
MAVLRGKTRNLPLRLGIIVLTVAAAAIHLSRAVANPRITALFTLNAAGYLVLLALLYLPLAALEGRRGWVRWLFIGYAGITFVLFFVWGAMKGEWPVIGWADKVIELALIALLWQEGRGR